MSEEKPKFNPLNVTGKKTGLAALLEQQKEEQAKKDAEALFHQPKPEVEKAESPFSSPETAFEKLRIIFDDSGSMAGNKIKDARDGVVELLKNCTVNQTAVAVHPLEYHNPELQKLTTNLPALSVLVQQILDIGSTPLFKTLAEAQKLEPVATRYVMFTDGAPDMGDEQEYKESCIQRAIELKTPVDTILIAVDNIYIKQSHEYLLMLEVAERTGGYFMLFDRNKMDFKKGFKYLSAGKRLLLADPNFRKSVEEGKVS